MSSSSMRILPVVGVSMQRRLATARGAGDRQEHPFLDAQVDPLQRRNELIAEAILLRDIFDADQGHRNETGRAPMAILVDCEYQVIGF